MGWLPVSLAFVASALLYDTGHPVLLTLAIGSTVGCFWSWGIMHNYATEAAKRRSSYDGGFYDITEDEADSVPNWIAIVSICSSALALVLLTVAIFVRLFGNPGAGEGSDFDIIVWFIIGAVFLFWLMEAIIRIVDKHASFKTILFINALAFLAFVSALAYRGEPILSNLLFYAALAIALSLTIEALRWGWDFIKRKFG